jgi:hypothetical protein
MPPVAELDGLVGYALVSPWFLNETPGQKLFQEVVASTLDDTSATSATYGRTSVSTFASFRLFQIAATAATADGSELTKESLIAAIKAITPAESTQDGLIGEVNYDRPSTQQGGCYYVIGLSGGEWTTPAGPDPTCLP